jgi:hypothetical protein
LRYFLGVIRPGSFTGLNSEALAGEVLLIKDPGHFAIDSGRLYVVTAAVGGDREGFEGEGIAGSAQMALRLSPLRRLS